MHIDKPGTPSTPFAPVTCDHATISEPRGHATKKRALSLLDPLIRSMKSGKEMRLSAIYRSQDQRVRLLSKLAGKGVVAACMCTREGVPLQVRDGHNPFFFTPRGSARKHDKSCHFGRRGGSMHATLEKARDENCRLNVSLDLTPRKTRETCASRHDDAEQKDDCTQRDHQEYPTSAEVRPVRVTLRGLLDICWSEAQLNEWTLRRTTISYSETRRRLLKAGDRIKTGAGLLSADLYLPLGHLTERKADTASALVKKCEINLGRPVYVIGQILRAAKTEDGYMLSVANLLGTWKPKEGLFIAKANWDRAVRSHGDPTERCGVKASADAIRVWAIFVCRGAPKGVEIEHAAWMACTDQNIPVQSEYENRLISFLARHQRCFAKPLCFDRRQSPYLPDAVLLDVYSTASREYPMEVWGMHHPDYEKRRQKKTRFYNREFGPSPGSWWQWDALVEPHVLKFATIPPPWSTVTPDPICPTQSSR